MNLFSVTGVRYFKDIDSKTLYIVYKRMFDNVMGIQRYDLDDGMWYGFYRLDLEDIFKFQELSRDEMNMEIAKIEMMRHLAK